MMTVPVCMRADWLPRVPKDRKRPKPGQYRHIPADSEAALDWLAEARVRHVATVEAYEWSHAEVAKIRRRHAQEDADFDASVAAAIETDGPMPSRPARHSAQARENEVREASLLPRERAADVIAIVTEITIGIRERSDQLNRAVDRVGTHREPWEIAVWMLLSNVHRNDFVREARRYAGLALADDRDLVASVSRTTFGLIDRVAA